MGYGVRERYTTGPNQLHDVFIGAEEGGYLYFPTAGAVVLIAIGGPHCTRLWQAGPGHIDG